MKLAVIGGGGVRSMFLAKSLAQSAARLGITELYFMDNNPIKLRIYGAMAKKVAGILNPDIAFTLTLDPVEAVKDADYVITTIRVGEDEMRVRDERIAISLGIIGQETTGAAGFSFAMRSIPALKQYCELIKKHAKPGVKVFNFTNPAGVVSQALRDMGYDFTFGICDAPSGMMREFAELYGEPSNAITAEVYGLNHCSFFKNVYLNGREITQELIENDLAYKNTDMRFFKKEFLREKGCILNEYLYYYYNTNRAFYNISRAKETRGELIARINKAMTNELYHVDINRDFDTALAIYEKWHGERENNYMAQETGIRRTVPWKFDIYSEDNGGYAGVALKYIELSQREESGKMILCVPNEGAIEGLEASDIIEATCDVSRYGARPHKFAELPEENMNLIRAVKEYEREAAKAIVFRNRPIAVRALKANPLVSSDTIIDTLLDSYIKLNKEYCRGWKG